MSERIYGVATKAWQIVAGCDERMPCAEKCWAKGTVNRLAHSPNEKTGRFHRGLVREFHDCDDPQCGRKEHNVTRWTGTVKLNESHLTDPLRWRKPAVIASGYHGDIFRLPHDQIDRAFAVMALCPQHTFLTLTKCAREMEEYFRNAAELRDRWALALTDSLTFPGDPRRAVLGNPSRAGVAEGIRKGWRPVLLPNLYLGFSASNQSEFDARAPHVMRLAAQGWKTWVSLEPLIGPVDMTCVRVGGTDSLYRANALTGDGFNGARLSQVVLGGESGKGARPCDVAWLRSLVAQCKTASVPCFVKQLGAYSFDGSAPLPMTAPCGLKEIENRIALKHPKGADPSEWPDDLRVQELAWEVGR